MIDKVVGIYGAAGHGRETMEIARHLMGDRHLTYVDDGPAAPIDPWHEVVDFDTFIALEAAEKRINIAIANSRVREKLVRRCEKAGLAFERIVSDTSVIGERVDLGDGAIISHFVALTSDVRIGTHFHANNYSYVAHDCVIGDFVTFGPRVSCNGNVRIGDGAYIGSGAVIRQGTPDQPMTIGEGAVVGMGAVVTKPVAAGVTVVGNPARPLEKSRC